MDLSALPTGESWEVATADGTFEQNDGTVNVGCCPIVDPRCLNYDSSKCWAMSFTECAESAVTGCCFPGFKEPFGWQCDLKNYNHGCKPYTPAAASSSEVTI